MFEFKFADIGEGIHEGILLEWLVSEGDTIKNGDPLFIVETDKVNAEIPSPLGGSIKSLKAAVGDTIKVGDVVVIIDDGHESPNEIKEEKKPTEEPADEKSAGVVGEISVSNEIIPSFHSEEFKTHKDKKRKVLATPVARKMAKDLGIDITLIEGSGINGRVMKDDIKRYHSSLNTPQEKTTTPNIIIPELNKDFYGPVEVEKLSPIRKAISHAMAISKANIPHAVMMDEFDVSKLVEFRKEARKAAKDKGVKLTYLPFIIKALSITLKEFPIFNSSYDQKEESIIYKKYYNVGIATDTDKGLLVPVIKDVDKLSILEISSRMNELVESARNHTISLEDLHDGTISITNYGAIGSLFGTPIIKHPEVAIIGIGKILKKPIVSPEGDIIISSTMPISLAVDHRVIDGADAGRFSNRLKELLSDPKLLLMS